jgi:hypothetical protein
MTSQVTARMRQSGRGWGREKTRPQRYGHPDRYCIDKQRYGKQRAQRTARQLNASQLEPVHAYPCPHCRRFWHVGHDTSSG